MTGEVIFAAKVGNWVSIKKTSIDEKSAPAEIAAALGGVAYTAGKKALEFSGVNGIALDAVAEKAAKGKRKGFNNLAIALNDASTLEGEIAAGAGSASKEQARAYVVRKLLETLGYDTGVTPDLLAKVYPDIKLPKPKGNFKKQKPTVVPAQVSGEINCTVDVNGWKFNENSKFENTPPSTAIASLSKISNLLWEKAFEYSGVNVSAVGKDAQAAVGSARDLSALSKAFSSIKQSQVKEKLAQISGKEKLPLSEAYFILKMCSFAGCI